MQKTGVPFSSWKMIIQGLNYSPQEFFSKTEHAIHEEQNYGLTTSHTQKSEAQQRDDARKEGNESLISNFFGNKPKVSERLSQQGTHTN